MVETYCPLEPDAALTDIPPVVARRFPTLDHVLAGVVARAARKGNTRKAEAVRREWQEIAGELSRHEQARSELMDALGELGKAKDAGARAVCDGGDEEGETSGG